MKKLLRKVIFWTADHPLSFTVIVLTALFVIPALGVLIR